MLATADARADVSMLTRSEEKRPLFTHCLRASQPDRQTDRRTDRRKSDLNSTSYYVTAAEMLSVPKTKMQLLFLIAILASVKRGRQGPAAVSLRHAGDSEHLQVT